jgi:hypothetical protein
LRFLQGSAGNFIQKESYLKYSSAAVMHQYPYAALGVFFIKNVTSSDIVTTLSFGGSGYTAGAAVVVGTPGGASLSWQNLYSHSSSASSFTGYTNFTVPASATVAPAEII